MEREKTNLLVVSGFGVDGDVGDIGDKRILKLADALNKTGRFRKTQVMTGCPLGQATISPYVLAEAIARELSDPTTLVTYSHGSLLSLQAACRDRFKRIYCGVFANGPLNPEVRVEPPKGVDDSFFDQFAFQYQMRVEVARKCVQVLRKIEQTDSGLLANCVTVVSQGDTIIPSEAQELPGLLRSITLSPEIKGHGMGEAKIAAISKIVADILDRAHTVL